jgi:hypothetical protein
MRQNRRHDPEGFYREFVFSTPNRTAIWSSTAIMDDVDHKGNKLTVAFLGLCYRAWTALLLEPVPDQMQTFRRVGILAPHDTYDTVDTASLWMNSGIEPQCITIV